MRYYKVDTDGVISVSTLAADGEGNITEQEYDEIVGLLRAMPSGKLLTEQDGEYLYIDAPTTDELPDDEALAILSGGVSV